MTYVTEDQAQETGNPIELYLFEGPSASFTYRYTSAQVSQTYSGDTYSALAIDRSDIVIGSVTERNDLIVTLPTATQMIQDYMPIPPRSLNLTVYRRHGTSSFVQKVWDGPVAEFSPSGIAIKLRMPSKFDNILGGVMPRISYQAQCNHAFGDSRCGVDITALPQETSTTATFVSTDGFEVTVGSVGTKPVLGGQITRDSDGEMRWVVGVSGSVLSIDLPFITLSATNPITLTSGCDRTVGTCKAEYANVANFGGYPNIPVIDVQSQSVRSF